MSDDTDTNGLHLPSLSIRGFRGINRLDIERLGRVTLFAGKNGVGKTTVLDAVRLFAQRGHVLALHDVLTRHEEVETNSNDDDPDERAMFEALFFGRRPSLGNCIQIGSGTADCELRVGIAAVHELSEDWQKHLRQRVPVLDGPVLQISFSDHSEYQPVFDEDIGVRRAPSMRHWSMRRGMMRGDWPEEAAHVLVGPGLMDSWEVALLWDDVVATPNEEMALEALSIACGRGVDRVAAVARKRESFGRRLVVGLSGGDRVPLRSLGDGAARIFAVMVAVVSAENGFLLIDEAENGIHHTLQRDYWAMVLRAARKFNVQVLATTHSWDCVAGFARAASDDEESEGLAIRLEADDDVGGVRAVEYTERMLKVAADQGIEVR